MRRAWIEKTRRAAELRAQRGEDTVLWGKDLDESIAVTGIVTVPVFTVTFSNTGNEPYPVTNLEQQLFGGGTESVTLSETSKKDSTQKSGFSIGVGSAPSTSPKTPSPSRSHS